MKRKELPGALGQPRVRCLSATEWRFIERGRVEESGGTRPCGDSACSHMPMLHADKQLACLAELEIQPAPFGG